MDSPKQKLDKILEKLHIRKGKIVSLILVVLIAVLFLLDVIFFHGQLRNLLWGFDGVMMVVFLASMVFVAGFVVIKSLFHVAAGLSLLIFLAQAYCAVPTYTMNGDNALKGLLIIGLIYTTTDFLKILYKGLVEHLKTIQNIKSHLEKVLVVVLFLAFALLFVTAVYQVMSPIIWGLCVYHR